MNTATLRKKRYPYRMRGNQYVREKRIDEILNEEVEFAPELNSGETLSTASFDSDGPTISSETIASGRDGTNTKVTFTITGVGASVLTVTTSDSRTLERRFRWEGTDDDMDDYS
jgi:hypothetical protein